MTFQPYVPTGGLAGWRFLEASLDRQLAAHSASGLVKRDVDYFRENIGNIRTADELVSDFRLLSVALTAFGLEGEIQNKFLIRKVLEGGVTDPEAIANRLSDKRYRDLSRAFGFGDFSTPNTVLSDFPDRIEARYQRQTFEIALGNTSETMRLALNAKRELAAIAEADTSGRTKWFTIMGTAPVRKVMEGALALPTGFATLPIDQQLETFEARTQDLFGSTDPSVFADPDTLDRLLDRYTGLSSLAEGGDAVTVTSPALLLLRGF
ncbi:MAG: DUF1217 domain-containing protein [Pseudomonadota bacterium]